MSLKKPGETEHSHDAVDAEVVLVDVRARDAEVSGLERQHQVPPQDSVNADPALDVELKGFAAVRLTNPGCTHARTNIHERNPSGANRKIVPQVGREADQVGLLGRELQ